MIAKLIFNLEKPEDVEEHRLAINARNMSIVLDELDNYLRARLKYEDLSDPVHEALQACRDRLGELRCEYES